jgi:RNase H-fold protein (predicted Holliday junction resolvase)
VLNIATHFLHFYARPASSPMPLAPGFTKTRPMAFRELEQSLHDIVNRYQAAAIVVGLPVSPNMTADSQTQFVLKFTEQLRQGIGSVVIHTDTQIGSRTKQHVPIFMWDETRTTREARRMMDEQQIKAKHQDELEDGIAASLTLQGFVDYMWSLYPDHE